jgi:DNA-binding ferritin-like protein
MQEWHKEAMKYNPSEEELKEIDDFANELWEVIKDKTTIYEIFSEDAKVAEEAGEEVSPPKRFRDISNGE